MEIIFVGSETKTINTEFMVSRELIEDGRFLIRFELIESKVKEIFFASKTLMENAFELITQSLIDGIKTLTIECL